jgi:HD-GYP domain-containing protein (c-di-GMP phosphodiesterase class II)
VASRIAAGELQSLRYAEDARRLYHQLQRAICQSLLGLANALEAKDPYTRGHCERVGAWGRRLATALGRPPEEIDTVTQAGLLHDIGKIGVRDLVLLKADPLTPEEFNHIKEHVVIGHRILAGLRPLRSVLPGVRSHHERYDGQGYPDGLAGENIPRIARILAVADAYDAMGTQRPYREGLSREEVEERLRQGAGKQWDARVVEALLRCRQQVYLIRQRGVGDSLNLALDGALRARESSCFLPALPT